MGLGFDPAKRPSCLCRPLALGLSADIPPPYGGSIFQKFCHFGAMFDGDAERRGKFVQRISSVSFAVVMGRHDWHWSSWSFGANRMSFDEWLYQYATLENRYASRIRSPDRYPIVTLSFLGRFRLGLARMLPDQTQLRFARLGGADQSAQLAGVLVCRLQDRIVCQVCVAHCRLQLAMPQEPPDHLNRHAA